MIAIRKNFVKAAGSRVACANFGKGECAAKANQSAKYPRAEKHPGIAGFYGNFARCGKNTHAYYQADNDHGKVEAVKDGFNTHVKNMRFVCFKIYFLN